MQRETMLSWSWMDVLTHKRHQALCEVYGDLDTALTQVNEQLLRSLGCREETAFRAMNRLEEFDSSAYQQVLTKRGIELLSREDALYPAALRHIPDPPVFLYYKGDLSVVSQPCIGLVGTRDMSAYGKRVTETFTAAMVHAGCTTVSGLARGIDTLVAKETLAVGGKTVAVLGHGFGCISPRSNVSLAEDIVLSGGLILSEFPFDTEGGKYTFPARNRIIAALSVGTVVLEAAEGSGALITADLALEYGREVFAVPGDIFDPLRDGCHAYIASGRAQLVRAPQDVLQAIGIEGTKASVTRSYKAQNASEEALLKALTTLPQSSSELTDRLGIAASEVGAALTMLELAGVARNTGDGLWVRL